MEFTPGSTASSMTTAIMQSFCYHFAVPLLLGLSGPWNTCVPIIELRPHVAIMIASVQTLTILVPNCQNYSSVSGQDNISLTGARDKPPTQKLLHRNLGNKWINPKNRKLRLEGVNSISKTVMRQVPFEMYMKQALFRDCGKVIDRTALSWMSQPYF
jgi:hypothetical protein